MQFVIVTENFDRPPNVFAFLEDGGNAVEHIAMFLAVIEPLINSSIVVPAIVSGQRLNWQHVGIVENFIFFGKYGESLTCCFVLVKVVFLFRKESSFLNNYLVLLDDVSMASGETLNGS